MAKECRKYGVAMILASQEARDFDDGLYAAVANYLILRVTDQDARALSRNIAPADSERRIADRLKALKRYQALFLSEQHRQPLHLTLGPPSDVQCRGIGRLAFPGVVCRHKGRVDAWQRNQLAKQLDSPAHVRRVLLPPDARNNSSR